MSWKQAKVVLGVELSTAEDGPQPNCSRLGGRRLCPILRAVAACHGVQSSWVHAGMAASGLLQWGLPEAGGPESWMGFLLAPSAWDCAGRGR